VLCNTGYTVVTGNKAIINYISHSRWQEINTLTDDPITLISIHITLSWQLLPLV